ncbi:hypothetical protein D049_0918B, partial [Vibrio parahaemolyticus VPTS-2010]
NLNS